jgi:hypothetical protein
MTTLAFIWLASAAVVLECMARAEALEWHE